MNRNYSEYFESVTDFFDNNFKLVIIAFLVAVVIEIVIFALRAKKVSFEHEKLYVTIITNVVAIIAIFVAACLIVGFFNFLRSQDWAFYRNYRAFTKGSTFKTIATVVGGILAVAGFILGMGGGGIIVGAIAAVAAAGLGVLALTIVGFFAYVIIALLLNIIALIGFIFIGFFTSGFIIIKTNWLYIVLCIGVPCAIFGAYLALKNYISSFKENIID